MIAREFLQLSYKYHFDRDKTNIPKTKLNVFIFLIKLEVEGKCFVPGEQHIANTSPANSSVNFDPVLIHITFILFDTKKVFLVSTTLRNQL